MTRTGFGGRLAEKLRELFEIDLRTLAVFRIAAGVLILLDLARRARFLSLHYSDAGLMPRALVGEKFGLPSLYSLGGSPEFAALLFVLTAVFAVMLILGYRTRLASFALWLLIGSLVNRNPLVINGGDKLLRLLLFWSLFLPLGAVLSFDARRAGPRQREGPACSVFSAALLLQWLVLYVFAGVTKTGAMWADGTGIQRALSQDFLARPLGTLLLDFPGLLVWMTDGLRPFEILGPLLLFSPIWTRPLRAIGIGVFTGFQLGLLLTMVLELFPLICTLALVPFIPGSFWDRLGWRARPPDDAEATSRIRSGGMGWALRAGVALLFAGSVLMGTERYLERSPLPDPVRAVLAIGGFYQLWALYADLGDELVNVDAFARLGDGSRVLLAPGQGAPQWTRALAFHEDYRGKAYLENFLAEPAYRDAYSRWLCRSLGTEAAPRRGVVQIELVKTMRRYLPRGGLAPPRRAPISLHRCNAGPRAARPG